MVKPFKRVLFFLFMLLFVITGPGTRPARAQTNVLWTPGTYKGTFRFHAISDAKSPMSVLKVEETIGTHFELFISGWVTVKVTSPTRALAAIDVTNTVLNQTNALAMHGTGIVKTRIDCDRTGVLYESASSTSLFPLMDNFDPIKSSFRIRVTIEDFTNPSYQPSGAGNADFKQCENGVSQSIVKNSLELNAKNFDVFELSVSSTTKTSMKGDIAIENWTTIPPLTRTFKGSWQAFLIPAGKTKGWKK